MRLEGKKIDYRKTKRGWSKGGAFTLVELMVVVAVIGIIAGIVLAAAGGAQKKAARDQAKAEIRSICVALEAYKNRVGFYPQARPNPSTTALFTNLTNFMTFKTSQTTNNQVLDPYGYPYWYRLVTNSTESGSGTFAMQRESFEVWSLGLDGRSGLTNAVPIRAHTNNLDDIRSWD